MLGAVGRGGLYIRPLFDLVFYKIKRLLCRVRAIGGEWLAEQMGRHGRIYNPPLHGCFDWAGMNGFRRPSEKIGWPSEKG
ncbi:hypothetical protein [Neisseria montereyensis]|uniref:Uncharacterized protein n=1 Tax=Neisseria montereyensis TaxID=2973938 RepID=A0ABT2F9W6_9NEIS|nr:hypothetical protein [Neisseria montereyensis]MCS4532937.1 hypothetical protein [Neisseria montereyensis]